jgi:hypothetical protein
MHKENYSIQPWYDTWDVMQGLHGEIQGPTKTETHPKFALLAGKGGLVEWFSEYVS